jgi:hypothetical protein
MLAPNIFFAKSGPEICGNSAPNRWKIRVKDFYPTGEL